MKLYEAGHRLVVSYSAGKDSTCVLEVALEAARQTDRLPVEVLMRDDEIVHPGTAELALETAARPDIDFTWIVAHQPVINVFNRAQPYFWAFDPLLQPDEWVREPPDWATHIDQLSIDQMVLPERFPVEPPRELYAVMGLRVQESQYRLYGLFASGGYVTKANQYGVRFARPIYDWTDGDVWKAIADYKWPYNSAYDVLHRLGRRRDKLRLGPPSMTTHAAVEAKLLAQGWPEWFDRVCKRLPGMRTVAQFGRKAVTPQRRLGETWEECFKRVCVEEAPEWIAVRAAKAHEGTLRGHRRHSTRPFPEINNCPLCGRNLGSWRAMARALYNGDPFSLKTGHMGMAYVEPEYFRPGAGTWGGRPAF